MATFKERIEEMLREQEKVIAQAYKATPAQYQQYITLLDQSKVIANKEIELSSDLAALGIYTMKGKTYLRVRVPYFTVDGRLVVFADRHQKEDGTRYQYSISSNAEKINEIIEKLGHRPPDEYLFIVWVQSELYGRLEGVSRIFWDGRGANETNPMEVAYTSALGRALAQAGIGLIGTGVASADEVSQALIEEQGAREYPVRMPVNASPPPAEPAAQRLQTAPAVMDSAEIAGKPEPHETKQPEQKKGVFKVTRTQKVSVQGNPVLKVVLVDTQTGETLDALATGDQMALENVIGQIKASLIKKGAYYLIQQYEEEEDPFGLLDEIA